MTVVARLLDVEGLHIDVADIEFIDAETVFSDGRTKAYEIGMRSGVWHKVSVDLGRLVLEAWIEYRDTSPYRISGSTHLRESSADREESSNG